MENKSPSTFDVGNTVRLPSGIQGIVHGFENNGQIAVVYDKTNKKIHKISLNKITPITEEKTKMEQDTHQDGHDHYHHHKHQYAHVEEGPHHDIHFYHDKETGLHHYHIVDHATDQHHHAKLSSGPGASHNPDHVAMHLHLQNPGIEHRLAHHFAKSIYHHMREQDKGHRHRPMHESAIINRYADFISDQLNSERNSSIARSNFDNISINEMKNKSPSLMQAAHALAGKGHSHKQIMTKLREMFPNYSPNNIENAAIRAKEKYEEND